MKDRKIDRLRAFMADEDWQGALRLAASFPRLGKSRRAIERGHQALVRPRWTKQMRRDPGEDVRAGIRALKERFARSGAGVAEDGLPGLRRVTSSVVDPTPRPNIETETA